jgi:hypothetical protein
MHFGEEAYNRVQTISDEPGKHWLKEHEERAHKAAKLFYLLAVIAGLAIFLPLKWPKCTVPLYYVTLVGAIICFGAGAWIGQAGGKVRHTEFRYEEPPYKKDLSLEGEN